MKQTRFPFAPSEPAGTGKPTRREGWPELPPPPPYTARPTPRSADDPSADEWMAVPA